MAWPPQEDREESGDEADEEVDEAAYKTQKDALIFAIDISASMLKPSPDGNSRKGDQDSPAVAALKSAYEIMQQRIIAQPKDMMGILLFGTEKSKFRDEETGHNGAAYPHCYLYTDLDVPSAHAVKALRALVVEGEDPDGILQPSQENVTMANVLFCANQIFTTKSPNFGSRRLFVITDNDNPHAGDKQAKASAAVRAKDLYDLGVVIELFPIASPGTTFDLSKFYDDIVYNDPATEKGTVEQVKVSSSGDGLSLLKSLISNINSKQTPKRSSFSKMAFEIAPGFVISVNGYNIMQKQTPARSCYVYLGGEQALLVESETIKTTIDFKSVSKDELKKAYKFGGDYVYFTPTEVSELKRFGGTVDKGSEKVIRILGFKPRSFLAQWMSVAKSIFLFPTEEEFIGSTRVFSALWQKLLKDDKMGIAWFVPRKNAAPRLVAVLPSQSMDDKESATPYLPAGLWLYPLPFADDIREVDIQATRSCPTDLIDKMRPIVQNLQMPKAMYNPERYPNPALQWHYKILQVNALGDEVPEQEDSLTKPKYRQIDKRVGEYMLNWKKDVADAARDREDIRAIKRDAESDGEDGHTAKKAKTSSGKATGPLNNTQLKLAMDGDGLKKLTVAQLKDILTSRGVHPAGKKADLIEALEQWLEKNA